MFPSHNMFVFAEMPKTFSKQTEKLGCAFWVCWKNILVMHFVHIIETSGRVQLKDEQLNKPSETFVVCSILQIDSVLGFNCV